jgi:hypothetical protein
MSSTEREKKIRCKEADGTTSLSPVGTALPRPPAARMNYLGELI